MVYKKYITKRVNGKTKIFGPYLYESKKVKGRVITTYLGKEVNKKNKKRINGKSFKKIIKGKVNNKKVRKVLMIGGGVLFLFLFLFLLNSQLTGKVFLNNEKIEGFDTPMGTSTELKEIKSQIRNNEKVDKSSGLSLFSLSDDSEYLELLVKTSDNILSKSPREEWTDEMFESERAGNAKQGYIIDVKPEGWNWGSAERDPKRFAIVKIPKEDFDESWLELEYDYEKPILDEENNPTGEYEIKTQRKYKLPLESFMSEEELNKLRNIEYNSEVDYTIEKQIGDKDNKGLGALTGRIIGRITGRAIEPTDLKIENLIVENDYENKPEDIILHGSSGTFQICVTNASGQCNYSSLNNWESGEDGDIRLGGPCIANITENFTDTSELTISGWTTNASSYVKIMTAEGTSARHNGAWNSSAYVLHNDDGAAAMTVSGETFLVLEGLQLYSTDTDAADKVFVYDFGYLTPAIINISNSIFYQIVPTNYNTAFDGNESTNITIINSIFEGGSHGIEFYFIGKAELYNILVTNIGGDAVEADTCAVTIKNSVLFNNTDDFQDAFAVNDYNAADQGYGEGTNMQNLPDSSVWENVFADWENHDFHLIGPILRDTGTDLSAYFTDDIDGDTRPHGSAWDIGPDEYTSKGLVSTTPGAKPFYTNASTNPLTTSSLSAGQSEVVTFWVNATGTPGNTYEFFAYANLTSNLSISNITDTWNVTITETIFPEINITTPINNSAGNPTTQDINYTYVEANPDSCWYTNDTNSANITLASCGTNITDLVWSVGVHNVTIWINDTSNNVNWSYVNFSVSNIFPDINFTDPTPDNASTQENTDIYVNYTVSDLDSDDIYSFINYDSSLVGWWRMDNDSSIGENDTHVYDWSGMGNNGTSNAIVNTTNCKYGNCVTFNGADDYVSMTETDSLESPADTDKITISMWFKPNDITTSGIDEDHLLNFDFVNIRLQSSDVYEISVDGNDEALNWFTIDNVVDNKIWQHVVLTYDNITTKVYKNSDVIYTSEVFSGEGIGKDAQFCLSFRIGSKCTGVQELFNGTIDEVLIFNRSLSAEEVVALYNASSSYHNFTDQSVGIHTFQASAVDELGSLNQTEERIVNITDTIFPEINITSPQNNSAGNPNTQDINYTYVETNPDSCWYTNDTNSANITLASCGTNITDLVWSVGVHNVTIWINDTSNNVNWSYVNFSVTFNTSTTLTIWDDSNFSTVYANYTKFYANYSDASGNSINGSSNYYCEFSFNKSKNWTQWDRYGHVNMSFNNVTLQYEIIADGGYIQNASETHIDGMPVGNYSFNVSCYDLGGTYDNASSVDAVSITEYPTDLIVTKSSESPSVNDNVEFYANYTRTEEWDVTNWDLYTKEIRQVFWNTSDLGTVASIAYFDCENSGKKDCVAVGFSGDLRAFYPNGTQITSNSWPGNEVTGGPWEIEVSDFDNDGYYNDIVTTESTAYARVFNETGDEVWNSGSLGTWTYAIAVVDLDNNGIKDDFVVNVDPAPGTSWNVEAFNTSDGKTWSNTWNYSLTGAVIGAPFEVVVGDFDRDGNNDDVAFASGGYTGNVWALNESGDTIFNITGHHNIYSLATADLDNDGYEDELIFGENGGIFVYEFNGTYGTTYTTSDYNWTDDKPIHYIYEIETGDIDGDGDLEVIAADDGANNGAFAYIWAYSHNGSYLWNYSVPGDSSGYNPIYSMSIEDINDNGKMEIVFADTDYDTVHVLNGSGNLLFSYNLNLGDIGTQYGSSTAIDISDLNNDGINDIAVGSAGGYAHIFQDVNCIIEFNDSTSFNMTWNGSSERWEANRTFASAGTYQYNITCDKGGYVEQLNETNVNVSADTTLPTVNLVAPANNTLETSNSTIMFIYNVSDASTINNCSLIINNAINGSADESITKDTNQSFMRTLHNADFNWSVNCTDEFNNIGASETFNLSVNLNTTTTLTIWDDSNFTTVYANYTKFYANYSDASGNSINGSADYYCEFSFNKSKNWTQWDRYGHVNMSFNNVTLQYEIIADGGYIQNASETHIDGMPVGNYSFNVSCYDLGGNYDNASSVDAVSITEYPTDLIVTNNDSSPSVSDNVEFYANYTRANEWDVTNWDLYTKEIRQVFWNTSDLDANDYTYTTAFFDCENKGKEDCVLVGSANYNQIRAFYSNGTELGGNWPATSTSWIYELEVGDLDDDGYENDFVAGDDGGYLRVFNETGDEVWNSGDLGDAVHSITLADLDNDGLEDDFAAGVDYGSNYHVMAFNTSDGKIWTNFWNSSTNFLYNIIEVAVGDLDSDGDDDVAVVDMNNVHTFVGDNGTMIFNITGLSYAVSVIAVDLDHDGYNNEVVVGARDYIWAYKWNGTWGAEFDNNDYIWKITLPATSNYVLEVAIADLDNDGYEDDIVAGDEDFIWGFDNDSNQLWNFTEPSDSIYSISVGDVNNDGEKEIITGGADDTIWVLNRTGSLIFEYTIGLGNIGPTTYGSSPATDISDINNDGINDIAVSSKNGYAHIFQDVNCQIAFNDTGAVYNMTWDNNNLRWNYTRSFASQGIYLYNITCDKGGYVEQLNETNVNVSADTTLPTVNLVAPANNTLETSNSTIMFIYNVSDASTIDNCSLFINNVLNGSADDSITKNTNQSFMRTLHNADFNWSVNCTDSLNNIGASEIFNLSVLVYGTLDVNITYPETNGTEWRYGDDNLTINATVTCQNSECGTVYAYARYNVSGANPDTEINTTYTGLPFSYIKLGTNLTDGFETTGAGAIQPYGITFDPRDNSFWVTDYADFFVYHFNSSYDNQTDGFKTDGAGAVSLQGITFDPTDNSFWVVDYSDDFVYHFNSSGDNQTDGFYIGESAGGAGAGSPVGITFDTRDNSFWVIDFADYFVYHFNSSGDNQTDGFKTDGAGANNSREITFDPTDNSFWATDITDDFVYHFNSSGDNQTDGFYIGESAGGAGADSPFGITFDTRDNSFWVIDDTDDFAYHFQGKGNMHTSFRNLSAGQVWNMSWTLNVTSSSVGNYLVDVLFNSSYGSANVPDNHTDDRLVKLIGDTTPPDINFTMPPTPPNDTTTSNTSVEINVSITESNLDVFKWNWNGTNYSIMNDSLVLMMNMDNVSALGENDTHIVDLSGEGNNGTFSNNATRGEGSDVEPSGSNESGKYDGCFAFDGDGDYVRVTKTSSINFSSSYFTFSAWIYPHNAVSANGLRIANDRGQGSQVGPNGWQFKINDNAGGWRFHDVIITDSPAYIGWSAANCGGNTYAYYEWHYVVLTFDTTDDNLILYVDGVQDCNDSTVVDGSIDDFGNSKDIIIGASMYDSDNPLGSPQQLFNGSIDEVRIYNRTLSADEIQILYMSNLNKYDTDKWAFYINQSKNATDDLTVGKYTYYASAKDGSGNENMTEERTVNVTVPSNVAPNDPSPSLVSVDGTNQTASDLNCSAVITDNDDGDLLNVTVMWIKNQALNQTINYNNSYINATPFSAILESENTTKTDNWTCGLRLHDGTASSNWVNSTNLTILNTLPIVTLTDPADNNVTPNRTQMFNWSGNDADNDALTYQINISLHDTGSPGAACSDPDRDDTGISNEYYIPSPYMNCLSDNNYYYNWTVRASDDAGSTYGDWATERKIEYKAEIIFNIINDTVSFGSLIAGATNNTTDNSPWPFLLRNDGNAFLNISINATDLWNSVVNPSEYFRYKADNKSGEEGSFDWLQSQTDWRNMTGATQEVVIFKFDWDDVTDSAEVDILVTVPPEEGSGDKESIVSFEAELGE